MQDGTGVLRFRLSHLQLDSAESMGMPTADAKHVFIIREALDVGRLEPAAGQQEFRLTVEDGDGYQIFVHPLPLPSCARLDSRKRLSPRGLLWLQNSICFQPPRLSQHVAYLGQEVFFLRRRERYGGILGGDAHDGAVEIGEGFFIDDGRDFAGKTSRA
jgi:hypothetical protein